MGSLIFIVAYRIFSCGIWTWSYYLWDLTPGIEPRPLYWECRVLAAEPPQRSLLLCLVMALVSAMFWMHHNAWTPFYWGWTLQLLTVSYIINNAVINILAHSVFWRTLVFISVGCLPRSEVVVLVVWIKATMNRHMHYPIHSTFLGYLPCAGGYNSQQQSTLPSWHLLLGITSMDYVYVCVLVAQSCLTLCDPVDYSPPGSSVNGILQARILEWVAISYSRASFQLRDRTWVSCIAGRFFTVKPPREAPMDSLSPKSWLK